MTKLRQGAHEIYPNIALKIVGAQQSFGAHKSRGDSRRSRDGVPLGRGGSLSDPSHPGCIVDQGWAFVYPLRRFAWG